MVYLYILILSGIQGDYWMTLVSIALAIFSLINIRYFHINKSFVSLNIINMSNILIALCDFYGVFFGDISGTGDNPHDEFVWGAGFYTVHLSLLVNLYPSQNIIVFGIIFAIHTTVLSILNQGFHYFSLVLIGCGGFYLQKLNVEIQTKRKLFLLTSYEV